MAELRLLLLVSRTVEDFKFPFLHCNVFSRFYTISIIVVIFLKEIMHNKIHPIWGNF